jgi:hypothetical protein
MGFSFGFSALQLAVVSPWWTFPFTRLTYRVGLPGALPGSAPLWLMILWIMVLGSVVPFPLVLPAVARLRPAQVGLISMIEPWAPPSSPGPAREPLDAAQVVGPRWVCPGGERLQYTKVGVGGVAALSIG